MTVDEVYKLGQYIVNKAQNGYYAPDDFNRTINQAQQSYTDYLIGELQQYQYGRAQARVSFGQNEVVRQKISPLIGSPLNLTIDSQGLAAYPIDFQLVDAMYKNSIYLDRIRYASQDKLHSYLSSRLDPIASNPVYLIESTYLRFYPQNIGTAKMSYIKTPPPILWAYTTDINGRPVYNPTLSINPVWKDIDMLEILTRSLRIVGVNLQANDVSVYAEEIKKEGQ